MENAIDALKIAFAIMVFVMALSITIMMFSQLNEVSKIVLARSDKTTYYEYTESLDGLTDEQKEEKRFRIVGLETIIPTLYKYPKERYTVLFLNKDGKPLELYKSQMPREDWGSGIEIDEKGNTINKDWGNIGKYYSNNNPDQQQEDKNKNVCAFDLSDEEIRHEPWIGSTKDIKKNIDVFLYGGEYKYINSMGTNQSYDYGEGFISFCVNNKFRFKEMIGEYSYNIAQRDENGMEFQGENTNELLKDRKKRVIIYQLIN